MNWLAAIIGGIIVASAVKHHVHIWLLRRDRFDPHAFEPRANPVVDHYARHIRLHGQWLEHPSDREPAQQRIDSDTLKSHGVAPGLYVGVNAALERCPTCGYDPGKDQR